MPSTLKNVLQFTGLQVGVPASQPHLLNLNGRAVEPDLVLPKTGGFVVDADETNVIVTRTADAGATLSVYVERWHSIENAQPLPNGITPSALPFVLDPGGGGGSTFVGAAMVNVVNYGAVGDKTTNDTAAILAAFDDVSDISSPYYGWPVFFPMTEGGGQFLIVSENQPGRVPAIQLDAGYSGLKLIGAKGAGIKFDSVCIDGVSGSPGIGLLAGFDGLDAQTLAFYGRDDEDDKDLNFFAAIEMGYGSTGVTLTNCTFNNVTPVNAQSAPQGSDALLSSRLIMQGCYMHNCPNGVHPPGDTKISNCFFLCDEIVSARAQAIYKFGSFSNIQITGCTFRRINKQAIQIRGNEAAWNQMQSFRISNCHFEECDQYAIFCGSDSFPNITHTVIADNTFRDCNGPIQLQGQGSAEVTGNVIHYTWQWPFQLPNPFSVGISATTGVGLPGHYAVARGINIVGNKLSILHPFVGKVTFVTNPADGDSIFVGGITYTFRNNPSATWDVQRDTTARNTLDYFIQALRGYSSGTIPNPNNVLRSSLDAFADFYGSVPNVGVIVSYFNFTITPSGAWCTVTPVADYRQTCQSPIQCSLLIAPHVADNIFDDFIYGVVMQNCRSGEVYDNHNTNQTGQAVGVIAQYNVDMRYRGNRCIVLDFLNRGTPAYNQYFDGFSIIDDDTVQYQEGNWGPLMGRSGSVPIGDGRAFCWLWYGRGIADQSPADPSTNMFRWQDLTDRVVFFDGSVTHTFTYKFSSPGANQFNSCASLRALFNAIPGWEAIFQPYINRLVTPQPEVMLLVRAIDPGPSTARLYVYRDKYPGGGAADFTQQPLINGYILRNAAASEEFSPFGGGGAEFEQTFVFTPIANPDRGVQVWGVDAAAAALNPRVYAADIIPGVGFKITHAVGAGAEVFGYRVNSQ